MQQFLPLYSQNETAFSLYCSKTDYVQINFNMLSVTLSTEDFIDFAQDPLSLSLFATVQNQEQLVQLLEGSDTALLQLEMEDLYAKEF